MNSALLKSEKFEEHDTMELEKIFLNESNDQYLLNTLTVKEESDPIEYKDGYLNVKHENIKIEGSLISTELIIKDTIFDENNQNEQPSLNENKYFSHDICSKTFQEDILSFNFKRIHTCTLCSEILYGKQCLIDHIQRIHANEKPYLCYVCQKTFTRKDMFKHHLQIHIDEREIFSCTLCDKMFSRNESLFRHKMNLHANDKSFTCDVCQKAFSQQSDYIQHSKVDNKQPFTCCDCKKTFTVKSKLIKHYEVMHKSINPYTCDVCGKSFTRNNSLIQHLRTHNAKFKPKKVNNSVDEPGLFFIIND